MEYNDVKPQFNYGAEFLLSIYVDSLHDVFVCILQLTLAYSVNSNE